MKLRLVIDRLIYSQKRIQFSHLVKVSDLIKFKRDVFKDNLFKDFGAVKEKEKEAQEEYLSIVHCLGYRPENKTALKINTGIQ